MPTLIISASSRQNGATTNLIKDFQAHSNWDMIDLVDYKISHYDYLHQNQNDDYIPLMRKIIDGYDTIVLATPVYWYAMSAILKVFFDRFTDLLEVDLELGRRLRGKRMAAVTTSIGENLGEAFWLPFSETARYLGMEFIGGLHTVYGEDYKKALKGFVENITSISSGDV